MHKSWSDNDAVTALQRLADAVELLAPVASDRRASLDETGRDSAELPIQNLPAHVEFARLWEERRSHYLTKTKQRECPVCRHVDALPWFATHDGYTYATCSRCAMVYIADVLPLDVWDEYFSTLPHARDWLDAQMAASVGGATDEHNRRRFQRYFEVLRRLGAAAPRDRVLDVGSFTGASLSVAADLDLDSYGIEGLHEAVRFVRAQPSPLRITHGHAETFPPDIYGGNFALITMWETLEHTVSPLDSLARAHAALAPGGRLAITVPNARNVQCSVLRDYCYFAYGGYQGIGHVNLFTPATLGRLFTECGFETVHMETEFGTDWRQIAYYLQHRFDRIHCYRNIVRGAAIDRQPGPELSIILNWLSPSLTRLENAFLGGPIVLAVARKR